MLDKAAIRVNAHPTISRDDSLINKKLPEELLLRIFSYLDIVSLCRCAQVCRTWNVLALDGSNWQNVDLFQFQKDIKASVVENLAKRCGGFLKKLSLRGCESVQDGALDTFARKCSFIEELNLEKCKRLTDRSCESLGSNCKRIQVLNLDCVSGVTQKGLKFIRHRQRVGFEVLLTDDGLKYVGESCSDLRVLNLQSCSHLTDQGIQYVAAGCHRLEYLCLSMCSRITDRSLQAISMGCQLLKRALARASPCSANIMLIMTSACERAYKSKMAERVLTQLLQTCLMLKQMLRYELVQVSILQLKLPFRDLEVSGCSLLTDSGFHALAKNCHDLERMDLEDCSLITDQTLAHLSAGCGSLIELSLSHCELITDEGIRTLALSLGALDNLTVLELDNCPLITDQALDSLRECRALKRLELYDCQQVSRGGIRRFKQVAPNVMVHAYFAPATPPVHQRRSQRRYCRCCIII
ncbi:F-box domain protein [Trichuris suis]|nr:F-box domain protein [Trichuris suis]